MVNPQPPVHLPVEVSSRLRAFLLVSHLLAALVVMFMPAMPWWGQLLLLVAVALSAGYFWRLHVWRTDPRSVLDARFYASDNWLLRTPAGSVFAVLDDSSFLHPWLCVLNLRTRHGRVHTLILFPDSVPADSLRQLRVRVRFDQGEPEKSNPSRRNGKG